MTYNPARDEPKYSEREVEEMLGRVVELAWKRAWNSILVGAASLPLQVFGRWEQGRVYDPSSLVFKDGRQWISTVQTASEPSDANAAWRAAKFPNLRDRSE